MWLTSLDYTLKIVENGKFLYFIQKKKDKDKVSLFNFSRETKLNTENLTKEKNSDFFQP